MFIRGALDARGLDAPMPQACRPFSIHSNVCVGDLVAIVACSVAGIGFFCWAIHAIRKMRQPPFNDRQEDKEESNGDHASAFDNSFLVQRGVVQTPIRPQRVQTRLALSGPEENTYRLSTPVSHDTAQGSMKRMPRLPSPAGGQSQIRRGRHVRGYGRISSVSPPRASGSRLHGSGSGYGSLDA